MKTLAFFLCLLPAICAAADEPRDAPPQKTLQGVLDRIKVHASSDAWKQLGFKDEAIEAWLDKLVGSIAQAAERPDLKLPVRLKEVQPSEPVANQRRGRGPVAPSRLNKALFVGGNLDWKTIGVQDSIILCSGNVDVEVASNSVIVARGVITVHGFSRGSVLAAGTMICAGRTDGDLVLTVRGEQGGSIMVSRGWVDLAESAHGTIVAAENGIHSKDFAEVLFVNAPANLPARQFPVPDTTTRSIRVRDLPLEAWPIHPLRAKLKVTGVVHGLVPLPGAAPRAPAKSIIAPTAVVLEFSGRAYVAEIGQPIVDEAGLPVAALAQWKLHSMTDRVAIVVSPDAEFPLPIEAR